MFRAAVIAFWAFVPMVIASSASASAESGVPTLAGDLAGRIAAPWPGRQASDGSFEDYVAKALPAYTRDTYGPAMLGSALVLNGVRRGDPVIAASGLRSIAFGVRTKSGFSDTGGTVWQVGSPRGYAYPFSIFALADVWAAARGQLLADPSKTTTRVVSAYLRPILQQAAPLASPTTLERPTNQVLVERVAWQELLAGGLTSKSPNSIVASPQASQGLIDFWIDRWLSDVAATQSSGSGGSRTSFVSDGPNWPHAYHAFSAGLLARLSQVSSARRRTKLIPHLRQAVRALSVLTSPAGDIAYAGRSTMMPWTLAFGAYAAMVAASDQSTPADEAAEERELASRLLKRLGTTYFSGTLGLMLTPSMAGGVLPAARSLDTYPSAVPYSGLTLLALEWIARMSDGPAAPQPAARSGIVSGTDVDAAPAVLGTPSLWVGLRSSRWLSGKPNTDLRYDSGPLAAQQLRQGRWKWLLPVRPVTSADEKTSWLRLYSGPAEFVLPTSKSLSVSADEVTQRFAFRPEGLGYDVRVDARYSQASCGGLRIELSTPSTGKLEAAFWLSRSIVAMSGSTVRAGGLNITSSKKPELKWSFAAPSATNPELNQVALRFPNTGPKTSLDLCLK